jgi:glycosyltransferase involved in cell wall biosynthesis
MAAARGLRRFARALGDERREAFGAADVSALALPSHTDSFSIAASDLGSQLIRLLGDAGLRRRLSNRARDHAKQYDWGRIAVEFVRIYREVLVSSGGHHAAA